jgi:DNA-binding transcriptional MerR regulator
MATQLSPKRDVDQPSIPDRLYFKIGDVARICNLETYVLRFWETQFPQLKPNKSGTGQRLYRRRDVEMALEIKRLVHTQGYTLAGARQVLTQVRRHQAPLPVVPPPEPQPDSSGDSQSSLPLAESPSDRHLEALAATIGHARAELREIAGLLASPAPHPSRRRSRLATLPDISDSLFPS